MTTKIYSISDIAKVAGISRQAISKRIAKLGIVPQKVGSGKRQIAIFSESQAQRIIENK